MLKRIIGIMAVLAACATSPATAAGLAELRVYPSIQYFTWEEFDNSGNRLLKEKGPLLGVGVAAAVDLYDDFLFLGGKAELFGGQVDYDGQTSDIDPRFDGLPVSTNVNYFGGKLETDFSWRLKGPAGFLEPFAGLGYRHWERNIEASSTVTRDTPPVFIRTAETTEEWLSLYGRLGLRSTLYLSDTVRLSLEGGAKYPFLNRNYAEVFGSNITIEPRGRWSAFGEVGLQINRFRPAVFYEGFRYASSPIESVFDPNSGSFVGVLQPRSESDIFGISFSYAFR